MYHRLNDITLKDPLFQHIYIQTNNKFEKSLIRIFAHKHNLIYKRCHNNNIKPLIIYKCLECDNVASSNEIVWDYDCGTNITRCKCGNIYISDFGSDDKLLNQQRWKTWTPTNCCIIYKPPLDYVFTCKKRKGDLTWNDNNLKEAMNCMNDNKIIV
jgi:hypothetical protein